MISQQKKTAVIYCRVSTKEQVEEGNSLATQEKICKEYANRNNYEIAAIFIEQGESAKTVDRTELKKLIKYCSVKKNAVSIVIAYKVDRISRNTDDYSQIRILLKRYGVEIKYTSENFENTPAGKFMENIIANVAQFDNDVRAERSIGGMKDAIREGRYVWQAPFGYANVRINGKATIAPNDFAPIVRQVFETIALNRYNIEEVRKNMMNVSILSPCKSPLSKSYFYRMIKNELYAGWINKFGERHRGMFQSVISEELYNEAKIVMNTKNRNLAKRRIDNPDFPLRRFFKHTSGRQLTGAWSKGRNKKYAYYLIHNTDISIRKEKLETAFKEWMNYFKMDIDHFEKLHSFIKTDFEKKMMERKEKMNYLENKKVQLKIKENSIITKNIDGVISDDLCKSILADINIQLHHINRQFSEAPRTEINKDDLLKIIREVLLRPGELWEKLDLEEKIKLQWFYFPSGIEIDKSGSRTANICRLFKLKELISPYQSPNVTHRNRKSNTHMLQLTLPPLKKPDIQSPEFWYDLREEVLAVKEILSEKEDMDIAQLTLRYRRA